MIGEEIKYLEPGQEVKIGDEFYRSGIGEWVEFKKSDLISYSIATGKQLKYNKGDALVRRRICKI